MPTTPSTPVTCQVGPGSLTYRDADGQLHREDGPAVETFTAGVTWSTHGRVTPGHVVIRAWLRRHDPDHDAALRDTLNTFVRAWPFGATLADLHHAHTTTSPCTATTCACPARAATSTSGTGDPITRHYDIHGRHHNTEEPAEPAPGTFIWRAHDDVLTTHDTVDRWLAHHDPHAPAAVRDTLHELARNWSRGDTLTSLHAAAVAATQ